MTDSVTAHDTKFKMVKQAEQDSNRQTKPHLHRAYTNGTQKQPNSIYKPFLGFFSKSTQKVLTRIFFKHLIMIFEKYCGFHIKKMKVCCKRRFFSFSFILHD
jgi:hypothetical protein